MTTLPRLYLITDRKATANLRPICEVITAALSALPPGAAMVQMREKDLAGSEAFALADKLRAITRGKHFLKLECRSVQTRASTNQPNLYSLLVYTNHFE